MFGAPFPGGVKIERLFTATDFDPRDTPTNNYTFSGMSLGTPRADRAIVAVVEYFNASNPTVTIGGVTATLLAHQNNRNLRIYAAMVPSGSTGNVVISGSGSTSCWCSLYAVTGLSSVTPYDTAIADANNTSIDVLTNGVIIAGSICSAASAQTPSWSGVTQDDVVHDVVAGTTFTFTVASGEFTSDQTVSLDSKSGGTFGSAPGIVAVSFAP